MAAFHDYSSGQNGNHEVTVIPDGQVTFASIANQASRPAAPPPAPLRDEAEKNSIPVDQTTARHNPERVTLNDLIGRFKDGWEHLAASTRSKFECHFKVAGEYVDFNRDVTSLRVADMRALKSKLSVGRKPSTVNDIIFKALGALFKLALEDEIIRQSPLERLKPARKGEIERIQPSWEQSQQIVSEVEKSVSETGIIVGFMRNFGVGQAEIKYLLGEHIDIEKKVIHFRRKKTGKPFDVPIFPMAMPFIERLKAEGRLERGKPVVKWRNPRKALDTACENLNLPHYTARCLRRCFIVHCLENGIDPRVVANWQGHKDAKLIFTTYGKHIDAKYEQREAGKLAEPNAQPG